MPPQILARRITTCPPRFLDFATCLLIITINFTDGILLEFCPNFHIANSSWNSNRFLRIIGQYWSSFIISKSLVSFWFNWMNSAFIQLNQNETSDCLWIKHFVLQILFSNNFSYKIVNWWQPFAKFRFDWKKNNIISLNVTCKTLNYNVFKLHILYVKLFSSTKCVNWW